MFQKSIKTFLASSRNKGWWGSRYRRGSGRGNVKHKVRGCGWGSIFEEEDEEEELFKLALWGCGSVWGIAKNAELSLTLIYILSQVI